jgi:transcriptional regulator with XRE-family HTH domain
MTFDTDKFSADLVTFRKAQGLSLRAAITKAGLSAATLSRLERWTKPDVESFACICKWIGKSMDTYFHQIKNSCRFLYMPQVVLFPTTVEKYISTVKSNTGLVFHIFEPTNS